MVDAKQAGVTSPDTFKLARSQTLEIKPQTEGVKKDDGKQRLDLIPPEIINALGNILTFGANKYSARNWEKGMDWGRVYGALQRHLWSWWSGEEQDPETGKSHLWHAACCISFLVAYEERGSGTDDRPSTIAKQKCPTAGGVVCQGRDSTSPGK